MNNNSESDTDIADTINEGIKDEIPCGQIPSNVKIIPMNFNFDQLVNESCSSGTITDGINIDKCIDNMDSALAKRHPILTLLRDIRRFDRDTLPVYANINNATFSPRFGSDDASTFFKLKVQEFNSNVKSNFREFLTVAVKEYADNLTAEVEKYWLETSAAITNGSSVVRLNDRVRSLKDKWADNYRQSATKDPKELSDLDKIKQELETLKQQTDKTKPVSEMDLMKKEIDDLKNVLGNRYGRGNRGRGRRNFQVFSRENLTNYEILVLAKGLKFIPSPDVKYIKQNLLRDFDELGRKMRCKYHFSDKTNADTNHPFRIKSGFKPSLANNTIENYLFATKMEICRLKINKVRNNLSKHERAALKTLRSNNNIIIKKADKNSSTVVLDKNLYIKQTLNFLNNSICYEQIHEFNTNKISETIQKMIKQLHKKEYIDDITYKYLANNANIRVGRLYMLPKIHKINHEDREKIKTNKDFLKNIDIPGRPIVSLCNSPIEKIGQFIDHFLKPVVSQLWTYTQDTTSFINKIEQIRAPDDIIMCTFDITSMYNSLTHDEILQAVDRAWYKICRNKHEIPLPPKKDFLRILQFILCNNEFEFNNLIFRQTCGIPMGAPMSPSLADLGQTFFIICLTRKFVKR
ncbi:unnamed protein product [Mytilus edulis]|uniref:Reverse transcriptase domain-containing protein n=1 Tax=Mytilus edulis TaxID=6550 RepID=A0A8S3RCS5_MYTED|nr:unnamed protein product [Mytilus edulis]